MKYLAMGYHVFVLHYSLAPERFPTALRELALLTAKIREHADEWRIDSEESSYLAFCRRPIWL